MGEEAPFSVAPYTHTRKRVINESRSLTAVREGDSGQQGGAPVLQVQSVATLARGAHRAKALAASDVDEAVACGS